MSLLLCRKLNLGQEVARASAQNHPHVPPTLPDQTVVVRVGLTASVKIPQARHFVDGRANGSSVFFF
jgi:hypothetical protein